MYEAFFGLDDPPFVLTPDPRFLLRSKGHHEILASLLYGITSQKGLMALIGDVGTGKTTLCRALLRDLPQEVRSALVLNPHLSDIELVSTILDDLGIPATRGATKGELMTVLSQYLLAAGGEGKTVVVMLDEAQQMSVESLEQIRILSNLETATRKLLQIVLVGQPELEERLKQRELRQLDQRIAIRCYLGPLSRHETFRYIEHRLRIAGLPGPLPFTRMAMARIHRHSRGIPRVINLVCDRALMAGFSLKAREITPSMVRAAIRNLQGEQRGSRRARKSWMPSSAMAGRAMALTAIIAAVGLGGAAVYWSGWLGMLARLAAKPTATATAPPAAGGAGSDAIGGAAAAPLATGAPPAAPLHRAESALPRDGVKSLLAQVLRLWGVNEDLSERAAAAWPVAADGALDIAAIAGRYQLAATFLSDASLGDLRAIGLPALVELKAPPAQGTYLLRRIEREAWVLVTPARGEIRLTAESLESAWMRSAWIFWRNVDLLPADPNQAMNPTVFTTLALRLQKLGYAPSVSSEGFQQGVRRFQRAVGLREDGIVGPRTTMALSRVVGGRFNPNIVEGNTR